VVISAWVPLGQLGVDLQQVAADHAARRMHQHVVADARAFGVQRRSTRSGPSWRSSAVVRSPSRV
jgi:hypothetical protein